MKELKAQLEDSLVGKVLLQEPLKNHTTLKIGGPADIMIKPNSIEGLVRTVELLKDKNIPIRVIGRGSNLLISDEGIRGAVIKLENGMDHLVEDEENLAIRVGAGYPLIKLATVMSRKGKKGLAFAGGIPGSVGGAVYMNAGAHGSDISKILTKAHVLFPDGKLEWLTNDQMNYSYRTSILQNERPGYCVEAELKLEAGDKKKIVDEMQSFKDYRRKTQPWDYPCAGSIFRNPLPHHAGKLIQEAGLKGYQIGGAQVSELHGNFIVNTGNATFKDVINLIEYIKKVIKDKNQIDMHTEVEIIGKES